MLLKTILQNKKTYLAYNNFRKQTFAELAPKESEVILYLLPFLICINHPSFPGFVKNLKKPFKIYNIDANREIRKRELTFKKQFNISGGDSLLKFSSDACVVQGIYTIGSVGTVSQTSRSDCDLWICIDKREFDDLQALQFRKKINLIKDWLDNTIKMPVYFFISDVEDIKICNFGSVDYESSGSAQRNVLKEEFYRTSILVCGKIPFWWVCYDRDDNIEYGKFVSEFSCDDFGDYDFIDFGDMLPIKREEYLGAALWQYNKSLTHPLKSIIKMLLLKMLLESPKEELLCHKLRGLILGNDTHGIFIDPSVFTMNEILEYSKNLDKNTFEFIKKCFYLRYEIKLYSKIQTIKERATGDLFKQYKIDSDDIYHLNEFSSWNFNEQTRVGSQVFALLLKIYKDIVALKQGISGELAPQDLTIIGRKLSSCLEKKPCKIDILQKPMDNLNLPTLIFRTNGKVWQVSSSMDNSSPVVSSSDIVHCIAYLVWNDIYLQPQIRMVPNATSVTIQEIINLANKIKNVFGVYDISSIGFENFLTEEKILKMLLVVSFEASHHGKDINDFCLLYLNTWGELFVRRFNAPDKLKLFLMKNDKDGECKEMDYYIQRNSIYYEKIIERTKRLIAQIVHIKQ